MKCCLLNTLQIKYKVAYQYFIAFVMHLLNNFTMKIEGTEFNQSLYDRLNDAIEGHENTYSVVDELIREFPIADVSRLLTALIDDRKALIHKIDTVKGLYATDRPELIKDPESVLFQII